jgi:hypothetical protein
MKSINHGAPDYIDFLFFLLLLPTFVSSLALCSQHLMKVTEEICSKGDASDLRSEGTRFEFIFELQVSGLMFLAVLRSRYWDVA